MNSTASHQLAEFAHHLYKYGAPDDTLEAVRVIIVDQLGLQIGCSRLPWSRSVLNYMKMFEGGGRSTVVANDTNLPPEQAAFVNATFGHGQDFDDTCMLVQTHPGAVVIPTAIAVAEEFHATGQELIYAITAGIEVMLRVAYSVSPGCLQRGHHSLPAAGPFGAAISAGLLLGLSPDGLVQALGIAGSFSGGLVEYTQAGGSVKRIHAAIPTTAGIRAAYFARLGLTGPETVLDGNRGFCRVFSDSPCVERLTEQLFERYLIMEVGLKAYNCCYFIHSPLEALLELVESHGLQASEIAQIAVGTSRQGTVHVGKLPYPQDHLGAQFSIHFTLAMSLLDGPPGLYSYNDEQLHNAAIRDLGRRILVYEDETCTAEYPENWGAIVTVEKSSGQKFTNRVRYPKGTPKNPMSPSEIRQKFVRNIIPVLGLATADQLYAELAHIEDLPSIARIMNMLAKAEPGRFRESLPTLSGAESVAH